MKFVFQPLIELQPLRLLGFEALTRFPDGASPAAVFDTARRDGTLVQLELQAIKGILADCTRLPDGVFVTLNASGATIESFAKSGLQPDARLSWGIELTEDSAPADCTRVRAIADAIPCLLLIDDAGVAHATTQRILSLRPDIVKLDRSMLIKYEHSPSTRALVDTLLDTARTVQAKTLAEGVETPAHLELVTSLGIEYAQGFHFSPGRPVDELADMLKDLNRRFGVDVPRL